MRAMQLNPGKPQTTPELAASYADRELMWRNIALIGLCNVGWGVVSENSGQCAFYCILGF